MNDTKSLFSASEELDKVKAEICRLERVRRVLENAQVAERLRESAQDFIT